MGTESKNLGAFELVREINSLNSDIDLQAETSFGFILMSPATKLEKLKLPPGYYYVSDKRIITNRGNKSSSNFEYFKVFTIL